MASPTLLTEANAAKMLGLIDSTTTTSGIRLPVSLTSANQTVGGDTTRPPGWMGVANYTFGDTVATPGGFTLAAGDYPILVSGGADRLTLAQSGRRPQFTAVHEGGAVYTLPGPTFTGADPAVYQQPLIAVGGTLAIGNAATNTVATTTLASNFGYITDILVICQVVGAGAQTFTLLDASSGTQRWGFNTVAPAVGFSAAFHFSCPIRAAAASAAFYITTTGTGATWSVSANGFFAIF